MTPYQNTKKQDDADSSSVPSVSLLEFVEELLREPKRPPAKKRRRSPNKK